MTALVALLEATGRHARAILPAGLVAIALLPSSGGRLAPLVPWLVGMLLAMTFARIDLGPVLRALVRPRDALPVLAVLVAIQPLLAGALAQGGAALGLGPAALLPLVVFAAAPPLSSGPSIALMLGYDATLALRLMLTGTLLSPLLIPASFWLAGLPGTLPSELALRTGAMLAGGLAGGLALRALIGPARLRARTRAMDGLAALVMLAFLLPLVDGLGARLWHEPGRMARIAALALALNLGGNLAMRALARRRLPEGTAATLGIAFGNRNVSVILAVQPDPAIALFVALAQIPIYLTPFLLGLHDRRFRRCSASSAS
ncbi:hypothetical protein [Frigidibacter sp. MR17.24]|uniref:hypothetical protein n=1 Tax=Frigidibacter sp. MR17.24 TaxID=3127345 RepID=UPI003012B6ED